LSGLGGKGSAPTRKLDLLAESPVQVVGRRHRRSVKLDEKRRRQVRLCVRVRVRHKQRRLLGPQAQQLLPHRSPD